MEVYLSKEASISENYNSVGKISPIICHFEHIALFGINFMKDIKRFFANDRSDEWERYPEYYYNVIPSLTLRAGSG